MNKTSFSLKRLQLFFLGFIFLLPVSAVDIYAFNIEKEKTDIPWQISADHLEYDDISGIFKAEGNVIIKRSDSTISASFLEYSPEQNLAFARGRVIVSSQGDTAFADRMLYDMNTEKGTLYNSTIFLESNHIYIKGDKIEKTGEMSYRADRVSITTCDGDSPDWQITGRNLNVTIEGYGTVFHSAFWTGSLPVLYVPFLAFPVKLKRQTGFLPPAITFSSERKGFEYFQPLYWAISPHSDATFYLRHMEKRGDMTGIEYRYEPSRNISGTIMYDFLKDSETDDGTGNSTELWGYDDSENRTNTRRYWFRMKHRQNLPGGIKLQSDTDVVSDQDYLREFSDMPNGYDKTADYFSDKYGGDIDTEDDSVRTNSLSFIRNWNVFSINTSVYWYDNVVARINHNEDTTLQKLPAISFNASRQKLFNSPVYFSMESEQTYFYRKDTNASSYKGFRSDIRPRFTMPLKLRKILKIEPSLTVMETNWHVRSDQGPETEINTETGEVTELVSEDARDLRGHNDRFMYKTGLEASFDIFRIFNINTGNTDKVKHNITTKLNHSFVPDSNQSDLPFFDNKDRIHKENLLTFSITNHFTARSTVPETEENKSKGGKKFSYNQFCRFLISQSYDINEKNEHKAGNFRNGETREEYLPLAVEFDLTPVSFFSMNSEFHWSKYEKGIVKSSILLSLNDRRGDSLSTEYSYTRDSVESIIAGMNIKITDALTCYGSEEYNFIEEEHIERKAGVYFRSQCWGLNLEYTDKINERRYTLTFNLTGLGDLPTSSSAQAIEDFF